MVLHQLKIKWLTQYEQEIAGVTWQNSEDDVCFVTYENLLFQLILNGIPFFENSY